ncbi:MAG TPA: rhomboid family intramembrane serine protease [Candidatus Acidoferrum sp.]|nr:rhomboid family intramembrane serine protease [Candidatus Acidoferrum sp.]
MEGAALCNWGVILFTCGFSWAGFRDRAFLERFIFWPQAILGGRQYYRLLTSGFLHANGFHLGMNMLSLYFFGPGIELNYGWRQFLAIYFGAVVGGNLLSLLVHRHHDYRAYGASGGVSGIILASIFLFPGTSIGVFPIPIMMPGWLFAILYLAASFYGMKNQVGNVGHDAHLGGALVGLYTATALHPSIIRGSPTLFAAISIGTVLLFLYLARNPLMLPSGRLPFPRPGPEAGRTGLPEHKRKEREMDAILAKISEKGMQSLTPEEAAVLRETSDKYKRRAISEKPKSRLTL